MSERDRLTLWLQDDERARIDEIARDLGISRNWVARAFIRRGAGLAPVSKVENTILDYAEVRARELAA